MVNVPHQALHHFFPSSQCICSTAAHLDPGLSQLFVALGDLLHAVVRQGEVPLRLAQSGALAVGRWGGLALGAPGGALHRGGWLMAVSGEASSLLTYLLVFSQSSKCSYAMTVRATIQNSTDYGTLIKLVYFFNQIYFIGVNEIYNKSINLYTICFQSVK